jgi:hypothetical protein
MTGLGKGATAMLQQQLGGTVLGMMTTLLV